MDGNPASLIYGPNLLKKLQPYALSRKVVWPTLRRHTRIEYRIPWDYKKKRVLRNKFKFRVKQYKV